MEKNNFEAENKEIAKLYHTIKRRTDLEIIISKIKQQQKTDPKLLQIRQILDNQDDKILPFYCVHEDVLFIKTKLDQNNWKVFIPKTIEKELIVDYHIRYGHMGPLKVIIALEEHAYCNVTEMRSSTLHK